MSLRDQLLKAGVATKKQHQQVRTQKRKQRKNTNKITDQPMQKDIISGATQEQKDRDKTLNLQLEQMREKKSLEAQIKQLITSNAIEQKKGEKPFRFIHENKIKTLHFSDSQIDKIIHGNIAIASIKVDEYYLIPWQVAEKIEKKQASAIIVNNVKERQKNSESESEPDDPYSDYEIPDDLMW